jgi:hypothetical protein
MGVAEKIDPGPSWRKMLGSPGMWTEFLPGMVRLAGARTAAVAVEMWKSRVLVFGAISKRGGKRGKVRGQVSLRRWLPVGLFHAFHGASFPQRHSHCPSQPGAFRAPPETAEVLLAGTKDSRESFSQEVKS